jgi:hypothetical protein
MICDDDSKQLLENDQMRLLLIAVIDRDLITLRAVNARQR